MGVFNIIYLSTTLITAITVIVSSIMFEKKHKDGYLKFLGIVLLIYAVIFAVTFVLEKPEIHEENIETIEVNSNVEIKKPKAEYHFSDVSDKVKIYNHIDYNKVGEYEIEYEVDTIIGPYKKVVKVVVVDTQSPIIELEGGEDYKQSYSKEFEEPGYQAIDAYEGDLTENVQTRREDIDELHFRVLYEVSDSSGNKSQIIRNVEIIDDIAPNIKLNGSTSMTVYLNGKYEEKGATAEDEKDGDLTDQIKIEGSVNTSKEGDYIITYKVTDSSGNVAIKERIVTVRKKLVADDTSDGNGVIYLTFDDGPSTSITPKILDILAEKNVKATFFIINYNGAGENLVKREYNEGHTVGIHGYSHDYQTIYQSEEAYMRNLTKLQSKIKDSTGYTSIITRFPGGSSNTISRFNPGIMTRLTRLVVERGFRYYDWNVSSGDAGGASSSQEVYNNVTKGLKKSRSNVVLMHDFSGNTKTLNALSDIIDYGIENGYSFKRITENTPMVTHSVQN